MKDHEKSKTVLTLFALIALICIFKPYKVYSQEQKLEEKNVHWQNGDKLVSNGEYQSAISEYTKALGSEMGDAVILNKRAQAFYLNKELGNALNDLDKVFILETSVSDQTQALLLRGKIHFLLCNFEKSIQDYRRVLELKPEHRESNEQIMIAEKGLKKYQHISFEEPQKCVLEAGELLNHYCTESIELRLKRAECALNIRQFSIVQDDIKKVFARDKRNTDASLLYAKSMYQLGSPDIAMKHLKDMLRTDPDNMRLQKFFRQIKKNENLLSEALSLFNSRKYREATEKYKQYLQNVPDAYNMIDVFSKICRAYKDLSNTDSCIEWCSKTIDSSTGSEEGAIGENFLESLLDRAECKIQKDDLEGAEADVGMAQQKGGQNSNRVHELSQRIRRLKMMASRKNYYKILEVEKSASKDQIRQSYRKLSRKYHPDRFQDEEKKKEVEKKFKEVTEAYEILYDDDKRRRYDSGEDMDGNGAGPGFGEGHPFFRNQGPGGFTFHFNGFPF